MHNLYLVSPRVFIHESQLYSPAQSRPNIAENDLLRPFGVVGLVPDRCVRFHSGPFHPDEGVGQITNPWFPGELFTKLGEYG